MTKPKARRWRCQGVNAGDQRCRNFALFETMKLVGDGVWKVPIKVKLCVSCDKIFSGLTRGNPPALIDTREGCSGMGDPKPPSTELTGPPDA